MAKILDKRVPDWLSMIVILLVICLCSMQLLASDPKPAPHNEAPKAAQPSPANANPAPVAHTPVVETPGPEVFKDPEYMRLAEYVGWKKGAESAVAEANHTSLAKTHKHDFDEWLLEHGVKVYDQGAVYLYLQKIADGLNDRRTQAQAQARSSYSVDWFPLEGRYRSGIMAWSCTNCVRTVEQAWASSDVFITSGTESSGTLSGSAGSTFPTAGSLDVNVVPSPIATAAAPSDPPREYYTKPIPKRVLALMADVKDCFPDAKFDVSDIREVKDPFLRVRFDWGTEIIAKWDEPSFK